MNARRSATCSFLLRSAAGLGVVRLHRHRRHDDRLFGLGLFGVGGDGRRLWRPPRPWSSGPACVPLRAAARMLCVSTGSALAAAASFFGRRGLGGGRRPVWRPAFPCGAAAAAPPLSAARAAAIISATLSLPPAPASSPRAAAGLAAGAADAASDGCFFSRRGLRRAARTALRSPPFARRPASRPPSSSFLSAIVVRLRFTCRWLCTLVGHHRQTARRQKGWRVECQLDHIRESGRPRPVTGNPLRCNRL